MVALQLTSEDGEQELIPTPNVLELLALYLPRVDLHSLLGLNQAAPQSTSVFPEAHLDALEQAQSRLDELSLIDCVDRRPNSAYCQRYNTDRNMFEADKASPDIKLLP